MSAAEQLEAFQNALSDSLGEDCRLEVVQSVHGALSERIQQHRESKDPEPLTVTAGEVGDVLLDCGVEQEKVSAFCDRCDEEFGRDAALSPVNLIDSKHFAIKAGEITISVSPEQSALVETRILDGRKYLLIPAGQGLEVNGLMLS